MNFNEQLTIFMEQIHCTNAELCEASELSSANISRYRSGERMPSIDSNQYKHLINALVTLARDKHVTGLTYAVINDALAATLDKDKTASEHTIRLLNQIIDTLDINVSQMAKALNYDASYISRIRSGKRRPSHLNEFIERCCHYIAREHSLDNELIKMAPLLNCEPAAISSQDNYYNQLQKCLLLTSASTITNSHINNFLNKLNDFDLDKYISSIHFDEMKVPSLPFQPVTSHSFYFGLNEMKNGELTFLKSTVLSKSMESVYICGEMPMEDMAKDLDLSKKWMYGLALMLKKGLQLNVIHNIDRPFNEMMLGLESWIPMYMTGQISPFYIKKNLNNVYQHCHYCSGDAALIGECINGHHENGFYYFTRKKEEVAQFNTLTKHLFQKSSPLMDIYRSNHAQLLDSFLSQEMKRNANWRIIHASLPIYTIDTALLNQILDSNHVDAKLCQAIHAYVEKATERFHQLLTQDITCTDEIPVLSREEFEAHPLTLSLSHIFFETDIFYTYEQYLEHLHATHSYETEKERYHVISLKRSPFRNIQITMCENNWVMVSKNHAPAIHFVIFHPSLRSAIEHLQIAMED